jgi:hypothetical protein
MSHRIAVPALCALFLAAGFFSLRGDSATFDETAHIAAGVAYAERGDFRLNPEHPPLVKYLSGASLAVVGKAGLDYGSPAWAGGDPWALGWELLNGPPESAARRDPADRLVPARLPVLALGAILLLVVYGWAREIHGPDAGLLALALAATCPTLLAHARLVTTDLAAALGAAGTLWAAWRWLSAPSWRRLIVTGAALGGALLAKYSCVLLVPALVGLVLIAAAGRRIAWRHAASGLVIALGIAYALVWAGYGLRFAASPEPGRALSWGFLERAPGGLPGAVAFAREHHLLPEAYLFGLAYARAESRERVAFLDGEESVEGWWRYFPEAFALKTPLAFLALLLWAVADGLRRTRGRSFDGWFVALPALGFVAVSIVSRFNIGHRHLTPLYPLACVTIAPLASQLAARGVRRLALLALLGLCGVSFLLATPGYLSYFNVAAGGTRGAMHHLVDSNLDWGQDLGRLSTWMDRHGVPEVDLAYFGTADPRAYGIAFRKIAFFFDFYPELPGVRLESGRVVAISATLLQGLYLDREREFAREAIRRGLTTRERVEAFLRGRRGRVADGMVAQGLVTREQRAAIEADLVGTWMDRVRTTMTPIGRAGDSILIYRIP